MSWFSRGRLARLILAGAVVSTLVTVSASPAHANAPLDGVWAGSVPACSSNHHIGTYANNRITAYNSYTGVQQDYGWFEWRYSSNGNCSGYQWTRLHIEQALYVYGGGWLVMEEWHDNPFVKVTPWIRPQQIDVTVYGPAWVTTASILNPGVYDSGLLYSPYTQACADFVSQALVWNWDLNGPAYIWGYICA
jgi:hypothetical protein